MRDSPLKPAQLARRALAATPRWLWLLWTVAVTVEIGSELAIPKLLQALVSSAGTKDTRWAAVGGIAALLGLLAFKLLGGLAGSWSLNMQQWHVGAQLRRRVVATFLGSRRPLDRNSGAAVELLENDVARAQVLLAGTAPNLIVSALTVLGALVVVARSNVWVASWMALVVGLTVWGLNTIRRRAAGSWDGAGLARKTLFSFVESVFSGALDIVVNRRRAFVSTRADELMVDLASRRTQAYTRERLVWPFAIAFFGLCHSVSFAILALSPASDAGLYLSVFLYIELIRKPVEATIASFANLQDGVASMNRLAISTSDAPTAVAARPTSRWLLDLDFRNRALCHPGSPQPLIVDGALRIAPGEIVTLAGRTGCGKSTVGRYIAGISSAAGPEITRGDLQRPAIAYFDQNEPMFDLPIEDNVLLFSAQRQQENSLRPLADVLGLPSDLSESAITLKSQEHRDAVVLMRALNCDADLVVLDEPFAAAGADKIRTAAAVLRESLGSRGCLLISHRAEWRDACSRSYVIDAGAIRDESFARQAEHEVA